MSRWDHLFLRQHSRMTLTIPVKNPYCYAHLSPGDIRLLRLMPDKDENARVQCQLFDYPLHESDDGTQLYEALSYAWGGSEKDHRVSVDQYSLRVTANLHAALLHLRGRFLERIIWIDAICINQDDKEEQGQQVQCMAEIYSRASRVIIWLGEPAAGSDEALEAIRVAADKTPTEPLANEPIKQSILALLQRPWFERVWVREQTLNGNEICY